MKKSAILLLLACLVFAGCKDRAKRKEQATQDKATAAADTTAGKPDLQALTDAALKRGGDWSKDVALYADTILTCANASPVPVKYAFMADAFETPDIAFVLMKSEDDKIYACALQGDGKTPDYRPVTVIVPADAARFYPGELPKADSCLNNTRVPDSTGRTAGWLTKVICR